MVSIKGISTRLLLIILDGFGVNEESTSSAIKAAKTPTLDFLFNNCLNLKLAASGPAVGLPEGIVGNSEVGHLNLGSGQSVKQDLVKINEAINNRKIFQRDLYANLIEHAKNNNNIAHLMGLVSDGGVHSHIDHILAISRDLKSKGIQVYLHAFLDGRDTPIDNGIKYIEKLVESNLLTIASLCGRSIAMDRDKRFEKTERAYKMLIGEGEKNSEGNVKDPLEYIQNCYDKNIFDEFIPPILFNHQYKINQNSAVFFINFRPDRARQLTEAFTDSNFNELNYFNNKIIPNFYLCMTPYFPNKNLNVLFPKEPLSGTLSEILSLKKFKQFKIAETEKYAHITYFFNGGIETPFDGEDRMLVNSPKDVATYDERPEMSAPEVTKHLLGKLVDKQYKFYLVNFANPDMVGHTGNFKATVKAIESVDEQLTKILNICKEEGITFILTADHGNADIMKLPSGDPNTAHTNSLVPFIIFQPNAQLNNNNVEENIKASKTLKDVSPTITYLLDIDAQFKGETLFL